MAENRKIAVGRRVRFLYHCDFSFNNFTVLAGDTGVVTHIPDGSMKYDDYIAVTVDRWVSGAEEWDNEVHFTDYEGDGKEMIEQFLFYTEDIGEASVEEAKERAARYVTQHGGASYYPPSKKE